MHRSELGLVGSPTATIQRTTSHVISHRWARAAALAIAAVMIIGAAGCATESADDGGEADGEVAQSEAALTPIINSCKGNIRADRESCRACCIRTGNKDGVIKTWTFGGIQSSTCYCIK